MKSDLIGALVLIGATTAISGCVAHAQAGGYAEAEAPVVFVEPPTLVAVDADVWVVRDYDYSVYYVGDYYWVYRNDRWYRSRSYDSGWVVVEVAVVPTVIVQRDHHMYVHYHGDANAKTRLGPREHERAEAAEHRHGPPEHAAEQHGGPPGHDAIPGVGNQRRAEDGTASPNAKKDDKKDDDKDKDKDKDKDQGKGKEKHKKH